MVSVERDQNYFRKNSSDKQYSKLYFDEIDEHKTVLSFSQYLLKGTIKKKKNGSFLENLLIFVWRRESF